MNPIDPQWQDKYWDFMTQGNLDEAVTLKLWNFPKSFYKYKGLSEKIIESIEQSYIWLAEIASLNDPFECSIQFDNDECLRHFYSSPEFQLFFKKVNGQILTPQEIERLGKSEKPFKEYLKICEAKGIPFNQTEEEQIRKVQNRWSQIVEEANQNLRICSFSLIKDSLLLWSHYSDEHRGICIEYDFEDENILRAFIQPVIYKDKVHKIGLMEEYTTSQIIGASLVKSLDWKYEQEWRLTIFKQDASSSQKIPSPIPKAIYLGTRFSVNNDILKQRLFKIADDLKIPIFQMVKHPNAFRLVKQEPLVPDSGAPEYQVI